MQSPEFPNLISLFVVPLNEIGITYMITGSLAAGTYGEPRLTNDVDLVIVLSEAEAIKLHSAFPANDFYVPPLEVIQTELNRPEHGHFNLIHQASAYKADIYLAGNDTLHEWALERRKQILIDGVTVWMAPPQYVIIRKLQFFRDGGSQKHLTDIKAMLAVLGDHMDMRDLQGQVDQYNLQTQWDMVSKTL